MRDIHKTIIKELSMDCIDQSRNSVLKNPKLQREKCVLVFEGIDEESDLLQEFVIFLIDMSEHTQYLKIILVVENFTSLPSRVDENFEIIEIGHLTID